MAAPAASQAPPPATGPGEGGGPEGAGGPGGGPSQAPEARERTWDYFKKGFDAKRLKTIVIVFEGTVYIQSAGEEVVVREREMTVAAWGHRPAEPSDFIKIGFARAAWVELSSDLERWYYMEKVKRRMLEK